MPKRVAVIGAGIIGSAIAYNLRELGAEVVIVDSSEGGGLATRASWAWINASWGNAEPYFRFRVRSMAEWKALARKIPELKVNWCGGLCWDLPADKLKHFAEEHARWGYGVKWLGKAEIAKLEPGLRAVPAVAVHVAEEGVVEPVAAAQALLAAAKGLGAHFLPRQHVKHLTCTGGRVSGFVTEDGTYSADEIVLAAGAGCVQLGHSAGADLPVSTPAGLLVHSAPAPRLINGLLIAPELHVRQTPEGRLIAGSDFGGSEPGEKPEITARELYGKVQSFISGAETIGLGFHTVGYRPTPRDGLPIAGRPDGISGLYVAVMHSGITNAAGMGMLIAREIMTGNRDGLLEPFVVNRPSLRPG